MADPFVATQRQAQFRRRPALFMAVMGSIFLSFHLYVWQRLVHGAQLPLPAEIGLTLVMIAGASGFLVAMTRRLGGRPTPSWLAWIGFPWAGILFMAACLSLAGEPVRLLASVMDLGWAPGISLFSGLGLLGMIGAGYWSARNPKLQRVEVRLADWPEHLQKFSIVQLSDVHVGHTIDQKFLEGLVARVNAEQPDLVVITGDLVDGTVEELRTAVAPLAQLRAREGVYFVTGNHEYFSGGPEWVAEIERLGIKVLRNERVRVAGAFDLVGVDDIFGNMAPGHGMDLDRALEGRDLAVPAVLLAHQPVVATRAHDRGIALQLSGHTHGGQLYPFHHLVKLIQPWLAGLQQVGTMQLYVHRGTGYWGPPFRLGAPGEIARIEVSAA